MTANGTPRLPALLPVLLAVLVVAGGTDLLRHQLGVPKRWAIPIAWAAALGGALALGERRTRRDALVLGLLGAAGGALVGALLAWLERSTRGF